jgi:hypothetical protein
MIQQNKNNMSDSNNLDWHAQKRISLLKESIGVLGGITGLIIALLWISGRMYAAGYFGAMGIPSFQVNFSVWEYAEVSWLTVAFVGFLIVLVFSLSFALLTAIGLMIEKAMLRLLIKIFAKIKKGMVNKSNQDDYFRKHFNQNPSVNRESKSVRELKLALRIGWYAFEGLYVLAVLFLILTVTNRFGEYVGQQVVLNSQFEVEVASATPLNLGTPEILNGNGSLSDYPFTFLYKDLRLLTYNDGKYYLFKDINPLNCKPKEVYIIHSDSMMQVTLHSITPIPINCSK